MMGYLTSTERLWATYTGVKLERSPALYRHTTLAIWSALEGPFQQAPVLHIENCVQTLHLEHSNRNLVKTSNSL